RRGGSRSARGKRASGAEINLPVYEVLPFLSKIKKIAEKKYPFLDNLRQDFSCPLLDFGSMFIPVILVNLMDQTGGVFSAGGIGEDFVSKKEANTYENHYHGKGKKTFCTIPFFHNRAPFDCFPFFIFNDFFVHSIFLNSRWITFDNDHFVNF
ncbi:MAG: hypothetical protein Q8934_20085, partial [Bacillota bacterium]|nr:hypothetical protein [Bacillota bacterium]